MAMAPWLPAWLQCINNGHNWKAAALKVPNSLGCHEPSPFGHLHFYSLLLSCHAEEIETQKSRQGQFAPGGQFDVGVQHRTNTKANLKARWGYEMLWDYKLAATGYDLQNPEKSSLSSNPIEKKSPGPRNYDIVQQGAAQCPWNLHLSEGAILRIHRKNPLTKTLLNIRCCWFRMNWIHVYAHDWIKLQIDTQSLERRQMKPIAWEVSKTSVISNKKRSKHSNEIQWIILWKCGSSRIKHQPTSRSRTGLTALPGTCHS